MLGVSVDAILRHVIGRPIAGMLEGMELLLVFAVFANLAQTQADGGNISIGVLARIAPQLNIFAIGFPVTIITGFTVLMFSLPHLGAAIESLYDRGFVALAGVMRAGGAPPSASLSP